MKSLLSLSALVAAAVLVCAAPAQAHVVSYLGTFGAEAAGATGAGYLRLDYNDEAHTLGIYADWSGLSGTTSNAHIHCCTGAPRSGTAGVALAEPGGRLPGFPLGIRSGNYNRVINLADLGMYNAAFVTASGGTAAGAESRLMNNLASGQAYFNIHSSTFGGGEIRAFVSAVPEPGSLALLMAAAGAAVVVTKRRKVA
jgi:CHRD domain/PEP-CTERM motif